jgi:hypothetical protein
MTFGEHLVMKKVDRGSQIATLYFNIFPDDDAKPSDFKDF